MTAPAVVGWTDRDLHAWQILRPLLDAGGYLPWSEGAMRPAGLVDVCNEIVLHRRRAILELGSGVSTIVLARLLRTRGGRLTAVEHDPGWAGWVRSSLATEGLTEFARVVPAALDPDWYAADAVDEALAGEPPDLVIVDGPPADLPPKALARAPAFGVLAARLAPGATVVLDDIARPGEQAVLDRWEAEHPVRFERREASGLALARLG